jgi:hypothetical protein
MGKTPCRVCRSEFRPYRLELQSFSELRTRIESSRRHFFSFLPLDTSRRSECTRKRRIPVIELFGIL